MPLDMYGELFLKLGILFAGIYFLILLTPKLAKFIDSRRKNDRDPEAPRPERVQDDLTDVTEESGSEPENSVDDKYKEK